MSTAQSGEAFTGPFHRQYSWTLDWSPDGSAVLAADTLGHGSITSIHRFALDGARQQVTKPDSALAGDFGVSVSPDGRWLAFARCARYEVGDAWVMPISRSGQAAGEARRLTTGNRRVAATAWTLDSRAVVFGSGFDQATMWAVSLKTGELRPLAAATDIAERAEILSG